MATGQQIALVPNGDCQCVPNELEHFGEKLRIVKEIFLDLSDQQRNEMLTQILDLCQQSQIHHLSTRMEHRLHEGCPEDCGDWSVWLPSNITYQLFASLDAQTLGQAARVCRRWRTHCEDPVLWKQLLPRLDFRLSTKEFLARRKLFQNPDTGQVDWKRLYASVHKLRMNWMYGRCRTRTFEGHSSAVCCLQYDGARIITGGADSTIRVWNVRTNSPWSVQTLVAHSDAVRCLHLCGSRLASGSSDTTIKIWCLTRADDWSSVVCKMSLVGHQAAVRCVQMSAADTQSSDATDLLVSGSYDKAIKLWDLRTGHCRLTLLGHSGEVSCLQFDRQKIVSGSVDRTIKVWSLATGTCLRTLYGHEEAVTCVAFNETRIASGSVDGSLRLWTLREGRTKSAKLSQDPGWQRPNGVGCIGELSGEYLAGSLAGSLATVSNDSPLHERSYGIHQTLPEIPSAVHQNLTALSGRCERTISWQTRGIGGAHMGVVRSLALDSWRLVSGSDDKSVRVWRLDNGEPLTTLRMHEDGVTCVAFTDTVVVSGSYDANVKLCDFDCC